jgi:2-oxoglutarate ferredoxin oxidoreductase subunit alpha
MASATHLTTPAEANADVALEAVVVRFAGDSGDGMQLTGGQFTLSTALAGNDLATFPDFPAEIRAPQGTTFGVSAFQINFGSAAIETAGDSPDVLVAMNPAALKVNVDDLKPGGLIIADQGEFSARNLAKAGYESNPLEDGSLARWQVVPFNISQMTLDSVKPFGLGNKEALRCKNMWTLGLALWMFDRDRAPIENWLRTKFAKAPELAEANIAALNAGHAFGETAGDRHAAQASTISSPRRPRPGLYRTVTGRRGDLARAWWRGAACGLPMFFGGYPITPASAILHHLSRLKEYSVTTFQAGGRDRGHFRLDRRELRRAIWA